MADLNKVFLMGRLTTDPELRRTPSGTAVTELRLATSRMWTGRDGERKEVTRLGMQYVPLHWQCSFPKDKVFAEFLTLIQKNPGKKIFVHCRVGDDRTGMMIAAYRMAFEGWSAQQAMEEMKKHGFSLVHRRLICPRLSEYEEHFPERFATKPEFKELRRSTKLTRAS